MSSYVVRIESLEQLLTKWRQIVTKLCGIPPVETFPGLVHIEWNQPYVPSYNVWQPGENERTVLHKKELKTRGLPFFEFKQGILASLQGEQWHRIRWFYYCDNDLGNTIRLYDTQHFETVGNDQRYLELWEGKNPDRVLIRGENLEKQNHKLKLRFLSMFDEWHDAESAPVAQFPRARIDVMGRCKHYIAKRHAYFEHQCHNNMPNRQPFCCGTECYAERPHNLCGFHEDRPPPVKEHGKVMKEDTMTTLWDYARQSIDNRTTDAVRQRASRLLNFVCQRGYRYAKISPADQTDILNEYDENRDILCSWSIHSKFVDRITENLTVNSENLTAFLEENHFNPQQMYSPRDNTRLEWIASLQQPGPPAGDENKLEGTFEPIDPGLLSLLNDEYEDEFDEDNNGIDPGLLTEGPFTEEFVDDDAVVEKTENDDGTGSTVDPLNELRTSLAECKAELLAVKAESAQRKADLAEQQDQLRRLEAKLETDKQAQDHALKAFADTIKLAIDTLRISLS